VWLHFMSDRAGRQAPGPQVPVAKDESVGVAVSVGETHDVLDRGRHERTVWLAGEATSVKQAREVVAAALVDEGWPDRTVEAARVVTSELVTNAVIHAETAFLLTVRVNGGAYIGVTDRDPEGIPALADPADPRPGGMGLHLVEALASEWGVERDVGGKVVWARLVPEVDAA
jgi:anti-sigma regulatory factor (Ser/Thr protein kinase)